MLLFPAVSVQSANFSFRGTFNRDDNVQVLTFTLASPGTVTIRSFGYEGGTNAAAGFIQSLGEDEGILYADVDVAAGLGFEFANQDLARAACRGGERPRVARRR